MIENSTYSESAPASPCESEDGATENDVMRVGALNHIGSNEQFGTIIDECIDSGRISLHNKVGDVSHDFQIFCFSLIMILYKKFTLKSLDAQ